MARNLHHPTAAAQSFLPETINHNIYQHHRRGGLTAAFPASGPPAFLAVSLIFPIVSCLLHLLKCGQTLILFAQINQQILIDMISLNFNQYISNFTGCVTFWCPCITFGQVADIVDRGSTCKSNFILINCFFFVRGKQRQPAIKI